MSTRTFRAPGRVNLIGEHTDYNDGFVMPAAIPFYTTVRVDPRADAIVSARSAQFPESVQFSLDAAEAKPQRNWGDYIEGVARELIARGYPLTGVNLDIDSNVPVGSGLSSSAALEVSSALALIAISGQKVSDLEIAQACQAAENNFVGMRCGIMDQFISVHGIHNHAILLDCRTLEFRPVPVPSSARIVIANTMVKHELSGSEYNERRADCEAAAMALGVASLRDATSDQLLNAELPDSVRRRAQHVIDEIERTERAADALIAHDVELFGQFMYESHESLRVLYEVSCEELDMMVNIARELPGIYGARMTGGGFGGCTVNLVEAGQAEKFAESLASQYSQATGIHPAIYICTAVDGAQEVTS